MQIITEKQLKYLLENSGSDVVLQGKDAEVSISRSISYDILKGEVKSLGYNTEIAGKMRKSKTYNALLQYLKKVGAVDKTATLLTIGGRYDTIEELEEAIAFERLNMQGILNKYASYADTFELVAPFETNVVLTKEEGAQVAALLQKEQEDSLLAIYNGFSAEEKALCPSFDELYKTVKEQCQAHFEKCKKQGKFFDGTELLDKGKNPYADVEGMWHFYSAVAFLIEQTDRIALYQSAPDKRTGYAPLDKAENAALRENLISVTPTFSWHCTTSSQLSNVFRFQLNEDTKEWLLRFHSDYDLDELEDLAFYKGEKLLFSSCTHEGFHTDLTDEKIK